jgi:acetyl-CoA carboxylase biotin carboxylase subunit
MGVQSVAVYSEADALALHVRLADEAICVGPAASAESYLDADTILKAAQSTGAEAIHPGYGFLSENAAFVEACEQAGIVFIGPSPEAIQVMGSKTDARQRMIAAGVPVVPGTVEAAASPQVALAEAKEIGFPVLLKAAAGGGGKGMRLVRAESELVAAYEAAQREASSAFGDDRIYLEKAIMNPRHIEIQVLADQHGNAIHLFERECSVQRRHQKVIEESPASNLDPTVRDAMGQVAVQGTLALGYVGAGTFEFLVDSEQNYYFLEMNTRLQVEHPVTELVTGVDLVSLQLKIAAGEILELKQSELRQRGHAIECRVYAEDPANNFAPAPGPLVLYRPPLGAGIRVDDGCREGDTIPVYYDPMIAKLCAWGPDRKTAVARADRALSEYAIAGIRHNIDFLRWVLESAPFQDGQYTTHLLEELGAFSPKSVDTETRDMLLVAACLAKMHSGPGQGSTRSNAPAKDTKPSPWRQAFAPGRTKR